MIKLFKKFAAAFALVALFIGCAAPLPQTEAAFFTVESYWNGDTNYPLAFSQGTTNRYVDLTSAKLEEKTTDETTGVTTAVFTYKVVMVNNNAVTATYDYKTMIKTGGEETIVAAQRADHTSWSQITSSSFNQPQYNATLILADHFGIQ